MRSKWFALLAREVPRSGFFLYYFWFGFNVLSRPSEQLHFLWNKLQIEWFVYKHEHHFCRMVFKSRECLRASACNKLVKFLDAVDFLMERSYRHKGDQSQLNLMHKFGMECEEHYRRYTYDQLRAVPVQAEVSVSHLEAVKGVLCGQDAQSLQKVFEQTCPRYARMDKLSFITNFPSLEIHRKILFLENYHGGVLDVQQKALAIADNRYLLLDPVSVYVPLLVG